ADVGCAVHADASAAAKAVATTATTGARRMTPILADAAPSRRPIGARAAHRFDPLGRWSVLLGSARSCAPTSARPSHPARVLSCCGDQFDHTLHGRQEFAVYAIVRSGGRQHKVAVGDVVEVDRVAGEPGST